MPRDDQQPSRSLVQSGTAQPKKLVGLRSELKRPSSTAFRRLRVTAGDQPLQIAFPTASKLMEFSLNSPMSQRRAICESVSSSSILSLTYVGCRLPLYVGSRPPHDYHPGAVSAYAHRGGCRPKVTVNGAPNPPAGFSLAQIEPMKI